MINQSFYSYLLSILHLLLIIHSTCSNDELTTSLKSESTRTHWINMIFGSLVSMLIGILISSYINHYQLRDIKIIFQSSKEELLNMYSRDIESRKSKEVKGLSNFIPLTPYKYVYIDEITSPIIAEDLIIQAKRTKKFTIVFHGDILSKELFIEIELIQKFQSIITRIEIFKNSTPVYDRIKQLLSVIIDASNTIQTWGDINKNLFHYKDYGFFIYDKLQTVRLIDIRQDFKLWYNATFSHSTNCGQIIDFIDIDGPLCSCSHRPYKSSTDTWSLWKAIAYTFDENLYKTNNNIYECLAITKISKVIEEKWTRKQTLDYINLHHANNQTI
ncbi:unnamed protein product [Rotaria socialis]|uniref:Uncharacterized protein n=1 Tax=Rotaria socialis TaxID=392032 RepID=A0A818YET5_9BILA|nr:unnamed protein product [Rotaria socialis]CAF4637988.1 unnamed protein product [Rotaria socialis]